MERIEILMVKDLDGIVKEISKKELILGILYIMYGIELYRIVLGIEKANELLKNTDFSKLQYSKSIIDLKKNIEKCEKERLKLFENI